MSLASKKARRARRRERRAYAERKRFEHTQEGWIQICEFFRPPAPPPADERLAKALTAAGVPACTAGQVCRGEVKPGTPEGDAVRAVVDVDPKSYGRTLAVRTTELRTVYVDVDAIDSPHGGAAWAARRIREELDAVRAPTEDRRARAERIARRVVQTRAEVERIIARHPSANDQEIEALCALDAWGAP